MLETMNKTIVSSKEELISGLDLQAITWRGRHKNKGFRELVMTYDSETVQIKHDGQMYATQICHQLCIEDKGILVRTMDEFMDIMEYLYQKLCMVEVRRVKTKHGYEEVPFTLGIIIYVHNLSFDLSFLIYKLMERHTASFLVKGSFTTFEWSNVIQFKDSKKLLGHGLEESIKEYLGEDSEYYKRCGLWDYDKIRSPLYKLSDNEIEYAMVDVFGLIECIKYIMKLNNCKYSELPVSQSTFVGRTMGEVLLGSQMFIDKKHMTTAQKEFYKTIHSLNLSWNMYKEFRLAYYGGVSFTHPKYMNEYIENPGDYDLSSEYPRALVAQLFPMSQPVYHPEVTTEEQLQKWIQPFEGHEEIRDARGGFVARFTFHYYQAKDNYPIPFLFSKQDMQKGKYDAQGVIMNGNRVYYADKVTVYLTDVDYLVVKETATWDSVEIADALLYEMRPLPKPMVKLILTWYKNKTTLKGIPEKETTYVDSKIKVNTIYGKQAQSPVYPEYELDDSGEPIKIPKTEEEMEAALHEFNTKDNRVTYFPWGVYTAAYGHKFLYEGMRIVGDDIRFCDTDSVKYANRDKYDAYFQQYNKMNEMHLRFVGKYWYGFTDEEIEELYFPKTIKGVCKPIGNWDSEVEDKELGTMVGAMSKRSKCYVMFFEKDGKIDYRFTVAGCSKGNLHRYCELTMCKTVDEVFEKGLYKREECNENLMKTIKQSIGQYESVQDFFVNSPYIPSACSGKMTKFMRFDQPEFTYTDEQGNEYTMTNKSSTYLDPCTFKLNDPDDIEIIKNLLEGRHIIPDMIDIGEVGSFR